jgi:ATP-dependent Clp protease ATP-binding subunit ClpC
VAKLVGAPPGYVGYEEGGQLTEAVRSKPYSIVLLDEIEKAHPDVFNILLQVLDDGRLTDNKGNTISFKNTVIICTSNIGSTLIRQHLQEGMAVGGNPAVGEAIKRPVGRPPKVVAQTTPVGTPNPAGSVAIPQGDALLAKRYQELSKIILDELNKFFKPELLNRFDEVVIFEPLSQDNMEAIAKLAIEGTRKLLKEQNIDIQVSQAALAKLAKEGFDPVYGARPLRRLIQRSIENPIAIYLINKTIVAGETITVDYNGTEDKFMFSKIAGVAKPAEPQTEPQPEPQPTEAAPPPPPTS